MIFLAIALTTFLMPADPPTRFDSPRMSPFQNIENTLSVPAPGPDAIYNPLTSNVMSQDQQAQDSIALAQSVQTAEPFLLGKIRTVVRQFQLQSFLGIRSVSMATRRISNRIHGTVPC